MTYGKIFTNCIYQLGLLLDYLPYCETEKQRDGILSEIRKVRMKMSDIEEMSEWEKKQKLKTITILIDSDVL